MAQESNPKDKPIPLYTKVGWVVAWLTMAIIIIMILRNCVTSVKYGSQTEMGTVDSYYELGLKDGQLGKEFSFPEAVKDNPVLRKSYNKGYREGMDQKRISEK